MDVGTRPSAVAVVSHSNGDGKSTVTANLASVPVGQEAKVAVVDADLRQPSLVRYFGVAPVAPTSEGALFSVQALELPAENGATRSLTLVSPFATTSGDTLARGLPEVLRTFNEATVVVDTPSLAQSADGLEVAKITGRALLVVDIERQTPAQVEEAVRLLREAKVEISGLIVNRTSRDIGPAPAPPASESRRTRPAPRRRTTRSRNPLVRRSASRAQATEPGEEGGTP
jgi:succinoglycan biosynthesis transport protein ExoP